MQKLILNDGTELENSWAAETTDALFLYIRNGMNILQIMMMLMNPQTMMVDTEKIKRIIYMSGEENQTEYNDYTTLFGITTEYNGMINVVLKQNR